MIIFGQSILFLPNAINGLGLFMLVDDPINVLYHSLLLNARVFQALFIGATQNVSAVMTDMCFV